MPAFANTSTLMANYSKPTKMQLEYLDDIDGSGKFPDADPKRLIRIYDFSVEEIKGLQNAIRNLIQFELATLDVSQLTFVTSKNCTLICLISDIDLGIDTTRHQNIFFCKLTRDTYVNMLDILEHLVQNDSTANDYNWLYDPSEDDKIDLLVSVDGYW